ncbi:golgin subfamily A member 6-like protein 22 [Thamnophis elegans]|uniref:golgin subfamily A member 6-like protein 22 n=1 Tax=Thamnophis elegans TaxID=35005 RepID=UPI001377E0D7|nr:golgin subfamily A member 6-like protein 22 [Thamnophis elegans]
MGGLLTCHQCSTRMESLKDHSFWDFSRTWVRKYFWFILVTFIVLILWIILYSWAPPEPGTICPKDQANLLHNISQMEAEKVTLRKQLIEMEKEMQKLRNVTNGTQEKTLQLLEKKQEEVDALSKELLGFNQSLVLTRQLLEKEKEKGQNLQSKLQSTKEIQQQRDSCQKELAPPEPGRICPKDQANLLHNISQMEAEKVTLRKQLIEMEKEMQKLRNVTNRTQEKTLQLLEKKQEEVDALSKELLGFNQSLVLTRQLLEKEKEKGQNLQSKLQSTKEIQQQRDSCQKELNTLEEKLKSPDSKAEEYKGKVADLQRQLEQEQKNRDFDKRERASDQKRIRELNDQIDNKNYDNFLACAIGIFFISFSCCFCAGFWKLVK